MSSSTNNGTREVNMADDDDDGGGGATHREPWEGKQIILILCGLIASGKVHYAHTTCRNRISHFVFGAFS